MKDQKLLIKIYEREIEIKNESDIYLKSITKSKIHANSPIGLLPLPYQEVLEFGIISKWKLGRVLTNLEKHNLLIVYKSAKTKHLQKMIKRKDPNFNPLLSYRIKKIELTPEGRFIAKILIRAEQR